ncbi:UDP-N-acetylmuramate--L-alanine ligase [Demequina sp. SYSU T00192]|uniref:UDP-N-acetylmuramate--L-alanine ligase n=1 Tax=Demequina litoralis TaxID=3051660 RepID=A0ABT8GAN3_9MICO|nr:UDP-N-acetylmuramate--L-alanine ligase [Demequina sp. SYSU T00192]MDN4476190.1 UDP-N-acetylmuramate--L-alanine ligase [Demequina sp. SYSU T00192]
MSERIHFIGVGGSGMSAVARLIAARGYTVSGTNLAETAYFQALADAGMDVQLGHDAALVDGAAAVVVSTAVRETNVELARARELGIPVWHRSEALVRALEGQRLVAVAGSHGKTTTSAMVAHALHASGIDAGFAVGARVFGIEGAVAGGYAGSAGISVLEADESDGSFLRYHPEVAILLNIEPDHLDFHGTVENLHRAFADFAAQSRTVIACVDDAVVRRLADEARAAGVRVLTYGSPSSGADAVVGPETLAYEGREVPLAVSAPGAHNRLNATAAWLAAVEMGADPEAAAASFSTFAGTGRRYQLRGDAAGVRVIDDYAHHPTEVAALLRAARDGGAGHIVVLFQPALFTRTQMHAESFGRALSVADADVVLAPVHGDREDPIPGVSSASIAAHAVMPEGSTLTLADDLEHAARLAADAARPGDTVYTVGSGTVTLAADWILARLAERDV